MPSYSQTPLARRVLDDWAPPAALRGARAARRRLRGDGAARGATATAAGSTPATAPSPVAASEEAAPAGLTGIPRWDDLTERSLEELKSCDDRYRPTNFWGPGLTQLLADMREHGLAGFKTWPTAGYWFYPTYGVGFTNATIRRTFRFTERFNTRVSLPWMNGALSGIWEARRDFDAARLAWNQERWPFDHDGFGESTVGSPWQHYKLTDSKEVGWGRPYLNYLLCLAALSQHVQEVPKSFLELGGGFGVLGEIVLSRDPEARYVDLDIPPLLTTSSYYLTELFGDRVSTYDEAIAASGPIPLQGSACLPNYRIDDLEQAFDVFLNAYSFQEMEPDVVEQYIESVCRIGPKYVVSLNSRSGKPKVSEGHEIGVVEPVTSGYIIDEFTRRGYTLRATYNRPLIVSAGELAVLKKD